MTSIFSNALKGLKNNPETVTKQEKTLSGYGGSKRDSSGPDQSGSILDRIKLNKKPSKEIKTINLRKNYSDSDDEDRFAISNIQNKVIKKDISSLKHPTQKVTSEGMWKHDMYTGPSVVNTARTAQSTVFVRNVPEMMSGQHLKEILRSSESVIGVRLDNGTAEINFSRAGDAQKAVEDLNGKLVRGKQLKAAIVGEINKNPLEKTSSKVVERIEAAKEGIRSRVQPKPKMQSDNYDDTKSSILSRIKKAR